MKYRLLRGQHISGERHPDTVVDGVVVQGKKIVYKAGDVFESPIDLVARFNDPRMAEQKFERVFSDDPLDAMTVAQLREFAEEEEIALPNNAKKQDILNIIRGHKVTA